jgi:hypothetical protein
VVALAAVSECDGAIDSGQLRMRRQHGHILGASLGILAFLEQRLGPGQQLRAVVALQLHVQRIFLVLDGDFLAVGDEIRRLDLDTPQALP